MLAPWLEIRRSPSSAAGSTYTPELIEGFAAAPSGSASTELALHDIDGEPARHRRRPGRAGSCDARGFAGRLELTGDREARDRRRRLRARPAAGRRARRPAAGRDDPAPVRVPRPGDDGRGRLRQGASHRPRRARHRPPTRPGLAPTAPGCSTSRTRPGSSTQALIDHGHRAIGLCNIPIGFQRQFADRLGVDARSGRARARRPEPPLVGAGRPRSTARTGCPASSTSSPTSSARTSTCPAT